MQTVNIHEGIDNTLVILISTPDLGELSIRYSS